MLEALLIIAAMASAGATVCLLTRCASENTALGSIEVSMLARRFGGDLHRVGFDGFAPASRQRWTAVAAALARPEPYSRRR